ncbi:MAG: hypothetical protein AMK75_06095, partial [Planctomycetes bacterium SM23_65]
RFREAILENLPVPVIGISRDGIMVVANRHVRRVFPRLQNTPPGTHIREVFPTEIVDRISRVLDGDDHGTDLLPFKWNGHVVRAHIEPVKAAESVSGCILVPELLENGGSEE